MKSSAISDKERSQDERNAWGTPDFVFDYFDKRFDFTVDAAASKENAKVAVHWNIDDDWFSASREELLKEGFTRVWCNPPYSNIKPWVEQARKDRELGILTALLVPATPDAGWWPLDANEYTFITKGRLAFIDPVTGKPKSGNSKGSVAIVFCPYAPQGIVKFINRDDMK
jgi:phage N-6-adenine-methyltransferase